MQFFMGKVRHAQTCPKSLLKHIISKTVGNPELIFGHLSLDKSNYITLSIDF